MNEYFRLLSFDPAGQLLGEELQTHDPNGNRIQNGELRLFFDAFDRLVRVERVSDGATVGRYRYDAQGRRIHKEYLDPADGQQKELFFVCDGDQEVEELDGSGNLIADYVWGGLYVDQVVQMRRDNDVTPGLEEYYFHSSSRHSVVAATKSNGAVAERYSYTSIYGNLQVTDSFGGARTPNAEIKNPWRFQGRRFDPETGFYYFRHRYLDPARGRFVSRDPLGLWGDPGNLGNPYAFCGNDPVNCADPLGLRWNIGPLSIPTSTKEFEEDAEGVRDWIERKIEKPSERWFKKKIEPTLDRAYKEGEKWNKAANEVVEEEIEDVKKIPEAAKGAASSFASDPLGTIAKAPSALWEAVKEVVVGPSEKVVDAREEFAMGRAHEGRKSSVRAGVGYAGQILLGKLLKDLAKKVLVRLGKKPRKATCRKDRMEDGRTREEWEQRERRNREVYEEAERLIQENRERGKRGEIIPSDEGAKIDRKKRLLGIKDYPATDPDAPTIGY
jgi:RHS repeat-associated protein